MDTPLAGGVNLGGTAAVSPQGAPVLFLLLNYAKGMTDVAEVQVLLPDGSERAYPAGITAGDVAKDLSPRLAKEAVVAMANDRLVDLDAQLTGRVALRILTPDQPEGLDTLRHSTAHLMAQAIMRLYPGTKLAIGPTIENGFYYDIECPKQLSTDDFEAIEAEMLKIVKEDLPIRREEISKADAEQMFQKDGETFKLEIIEDLEDGSISLYRQGEFVDLCRGPHVPSTGRLKAFKLLSVAGAYWRGDSSRPMLQRIYGTAFAKRSELEEHLRRLEEAAKRDHRKLGRELDLFSFRDEAPGFTFWHPKGQTLYRTLESFSREIQERYGYEEVATPWIFRPQLWETSGHWQHYKENMFIIEAEEETMGVKPMNCPAHCLLYKRETRSYRDLPIRYAEYGPLSRFELSGTLHGLLRVRGFHQDDAHLFVREDQIEEEIASVLGIVDEIYSTFGMEYKIKLSTRPDDFLGEIETWDRAEAALARALERLNLPYTLNEKDGAFYGPKLDFDVTDALGRSWQCATVQLDFQFPQRFDLTYVDQDGKEQRPVMIHRAILGTIERFIGILTEHFAGAYPTWLAPVQIRTIPIAERHHEFAKQIHDQLRAAGLRCELDDRNEKVGYKIRDAQVQKIPYMLVIGDREMEQGAVAVRHRSEGDLGSMPVGEFLSKVRAEVESRSL